MQYVPIRRRNFATCPPPGENSVWTPGCGYDLYDGFACGLWGTHSRLPFW